MLQPEAGKAAEVDLAGVSYDELPSTIYRSYYLKPDNGVAFRSVSANSQNTSGFANFVDGISHCSTAKALHQASHSGGMT